MIIKLSSLRNDSVAERDGKWVELEGLQGARARLRSSQYGPFVDARAALTKKLAIQYPRTPVPDDVMARELGALMAAHLVLGWDGFDIEYTPEVAREIITDPDHRLLRDLLASAAATVGKPEIESIA